MEENLLWFGIFIFLLFMGGVFYTMKEFSEMNEHPEKYRNKRDDEFPKVKPD
jgi:1,4-alpha-glucan branching enzyme